MTPFSTMPSAFLYVCVYTPNAFNLDKNPGPIFHLEIVEDVHNKETACILGYKQHLEALGNTSNLKKYDKSCDFAIEISTWELFLTLLCAGRSLRFIPFQIKQGEAIIEVIKKEGSQFLTFPTV